MHITLTLMYSLNTAARWEKLLDAKILLNLYTLKENTLQDVNNDQGCLDAFPVLKVTIWSLRAWCMNIYFLVVFHISKQHHTKLLHGYHD